MKKVLLMTDFSDNARNAIKFAIHSFGNTVEYLLIHTYIVRKPTGSFANFGELMRKDAESSMKDELNQLKKEMPAASDVKITALCRESNTIDLINDIHEKQNVELIVMGTKGASGLGKILMGSVTASVIKKTKYPVLSIPENAVYKPMNKIVVATDLESESSAEVLQPLSNIATKYQSEILLVHNLKPEESAVQPDQLKLDQLKSTFAFEGTKQSIHILESTSTVEGIEQFCTENNVDLLTVIAHHNGFFEKLFHKSVSRELAFSLKIPLLTLKDFH